MVNSLSAAEVVQLLEEATQSPDGTIAESTDLASLDGWDSMGMVMFMGLVNEKASIELAVADLRDCPTPTQIAETIAQIAAN